MLDAINQHCRVSRFLVYLHRRVLVLRFRCGMTSPVGEEANDGVFNLLVTIFNVDTFIRALGHSVRN
jgi:hypothetical protein